MPKPTPTGAGPSLSRASWPRRASITSRPCASGAPGGRTQPADPEAEEALALASADRPQYVSGRASAGCNGTMGGPRIEKRIGGMTHSRLIPVIETARLIQCRLQDVLLTFVAHRITNAVATDPSSAARRRVHRLEIGRASCRVSG